MKLIRATFENGVFKPNLPVDLPAGVHADVYLSEQGDDPVAVMKKRFPESFGIMPKADAEELERIINEEFGKVNPDEWR